MLLSKKFCLTEKEYSEIAQEVVKGNAIDYNKLDMFLRDTEIKQTDSIVEKYKLNKKEQRNLKSTICYYDYLVNDGTIFSSLDICFVNEKEDVIIPTENTRLAFAEYVIMYHKIYKDLWEDNSLELAQNIIKDKKGDVV